MDRNIKRQISLVCFIIGIVLVIIPDLKRFSTLDLGFSWPFDLMFYLGLLLMITGYYLRG
jgi:hypothetical protein